MNSGLIRTLSALLALALPLAVAAEGEIYKVVDEDGNVTFTDQRPSDTAQPMDLPPLSVIESGVDVPEPAAEAEAGEAAAVREPGLDAGRLFPRRPPPVAAAASRH